MGLLIILGLLAVFVVIFITSGVKMVRQAEVQIIERLGKYNKTLTSGLNIVLPIIDKPRTMLWRFRQVTPKGETFYTEYIRKTIDLREQVFDFERQDVITKDNVTIEVDAVLYFQITDPVKTIYEIDNLPNAIEKLTKTTLRNVIGELDLDECLTSRDTINSKLRAILDEATDKWGVKVNRVELQDITPPPPIQQVMEKQMTAERERRAAILEAEGQKKSAILKSEGERESAINEAEGEKKAAILRAEGEAEARVKKAIADKDAIDKIKEASKTNAVNFLIAREYLQTLESMTSGKDNKVVYIPVETTGILGSLGGMKEMLKDISK